LQSSVAAFGAVNAHVGLLSCATGMSAGIPKFVTVNLRQLNEKFQEGEEVSLETLQEKKLLNLSGREATLPLKVCCLPTSPLP
jgi:hypothetical protein